MIEFCKTHWLVILTLCIAMSGGVPGIITAIKYFKCGAKLSVTPINFIYGTILFAPDPTEYTFVFLSLTISNEGEKILSPGVVKLNMHIKTTLGKIAKALNTKKYQVYKSRAENTSG